MKWLILALWLSGCAGVSQIRWTRIDGSVCETTKAKPVWYSSETETDCLQDGRAVPVQTNHEDLSILGGVAALMTAVAAGNL